VRVLACGRVPGAAGQLGGVKSGARGKGAVGPSPGGLSPVQDGPRAKPNRQGKGAGSWITPAKGAGPGGSRSAERGDFLSDSECG